MERLGDPRHHLPQISIIHMLKIQIFNIYRCFRHRTNILILI